MVDKSFKLDRVIKTDIQVVIYSLLLCISYYLLMFIQVLPTSIIPYWKGLPEVTTIFQSVFPVWNSVYWFATAYIFLLFISPVLNILISHLSARHHMMVILGLAAVSIWQLLSKFSAYWNNLLYAVIIYMIGAWIRIYIDRIYVSRVGLKMSCVIGGAALLLFLSRWNMCPMVLLRSGLSGPNIPCSEEFLFSPWLLRRAYFTLWCGGHPSPAACASWHR